MEALQKAIKIIFFFLLMSIKFYPQEINDFYLTKDTIKISNPVLISIKGNANKIIVSYEEYNKNTDIESLLNENKAFLYFDDSMGLGFYINDIWKKNNFKILECECCDKTNFINKGNVKIIRFPLSIMNFHLGFTKFSFYNKNVVTADLKKVLIKNNQKFYPILFPICK